MTTFERCHTGGEAYETWKRIEPKMSSALRAATKELLVQQYLKFEMGHAINNARYQFFYVSWLLALEKEGVSEEYPYAHYTFVRTHPYAREASSEAKRRLGIEL